MSNPTKAPASSKETVIGAIAVAVVVAIGLSMCGDSDADKAAAESKRSADEAACAKDLQCQGDKGSISAGIRCKSHVEKLAKNSMKWTDGTLEPKFGHFRWADKPAGSITFIGDKAQFQNGFGAYINVVYECDLDKSLNQVLDVRVREGRL
ncbi:zinc ribbon domain-containing protein [Variovorax paradoxus]|uniref:zinc ribbon domain-containing protein n=1 Tax=Variovorax paradoxus TaxID=34073 RepID=UPI003ED0E503